LSAEVAGPLHLHRLRGGFPGSYLAENDTASLRWRMDFIRTYLERDIPQFGPRVPAGLLDRLLTMLAHGQGTLAECLTIGCRAPSLSADGAALYRPARRPAAGSMSSSLSQEHRKAAGEIAQSLCSG